MSTPKDQKFVVLDKKDSPLIQLLKVQSLFEEKASGGDGWRYSNKVTDLLSIHTSKSMLKLGVRNGWITFFATKKQERKNVMASGTDLSSLMKDFFLKLESSSYCVIEGKTGDTKFEFKLEKKSSTVTRIESTVYYESSANRAANGDL